MSEYHYIAESLDIKPEFIKNISSEGSYLEVFVELPVVEHTCPNCNAKTNKIKDYRVRKVTTLDMGKNHAFLTYNQRRYHCKCCGKAFTENNPFVGRYQRQSHSRMNQIFKECLKSQTFTMIAERYNLSTPTIIRYFDQLNYPKPKELPFVLGIDEFKGNAAGQKYQVILTDGIRRKIIDILPERNGDDLRRYFYSFPRAVREKVKYITMDMSSLFRAVMRDCFPHAIIVGDAFHIFRTVQNCVERVRIAEQHKLYPAHGCLKFNRSIMKKRLSQLSIEEENKLVSIGKIAPRLGKAYLLKEWFYYIYKCKTKKEASIFLTNWLDLVKDSRLPEFSNLLRSFKHWRNAILQSVITPYSNGFTEGCNNKIKVLKRLSYGIRSYNRLRNRILFINTKTMQKQRAA